MNTVKIRTGRTIKIVAVSEQSNFISSNDEEMDARAVEAVKMAVSKAKFCQKPIKQVILYGSYARGDFRKDSDLDIMLLVDLPEEELNTFSDELSELGFEYNVMHDVWFMPVVKNREHFQYWCQAYPFYSNVAKEGISLYEAA